MIQKLFEHYTKDNNDTSFLKNYIKVSNDDIGMSNNAIEYDQLKDLNKI